MQAIDTYLELLGQIQAEISKLQAFVDNHGNRAPEAVNWASVGDLQEMLRQLQQANGKAE